MMTSLSSLLDWNFYWSLIDEKKSVYPKMALDLDLLGESVLHNVHAVQDYRAPRMKVWRRENRSLGKAMAELILSEMSKGILWQMPMTWSLLCLEMQEDD